MNHVTLAAAVELVRSLPVAEKPLPPFRVDLVQASLGGGFAKGIEIHGSFARLSTPAASVWESFERLRPRPASSATLSSRSRMHSAAMRRSPAASYQPVTLASFAA